MWQNPSVRAKLLQFLLCWFALPGTAGATAPPSDAEAEAWLNDDSEFRAAEVSEGELRFLTSPPQAPAHHHHNQLTIRDSSLDDGWVEMRQCHYDLDRVPEAEIVYRPEHIRKLRVTDVLNIERAWVEGPSVQLLNVGAAARLCIAAETRGLLKLKDGGYLLQNGPYMRRFLDGFYPMRVSADVRLETERLCFASVTPAPQAGIKVTRGPRRLQLDTWFEGRLFTGIHLLEAGACRQGEING